MSQQMAECLISLIKDLWIILHCFHSLAKVHCYLTHVYMYVTISVAMYTFIWWFLGTGTTHIFLKK